MSALDLPADSPPPPLLIPIFLSLRLLAAPRLLSFREHTPALAHDGASAGGTFSQDHTSACADIARRGGHFQSAASVCLWKCGRAVAATAKTFITAAENAGIVADQDPEKEQLAAQG